MALSRMLTPEKTGRVLGGDEKPIPPETLEVWRCTKRYDLPYVKIGRLVRYREEDVAAFIERRLRGGKGDSTP